MAVPAAIRQYSKGSYGRAPVTPTVARSIRFPSISGEVIVGCNQIEHNSNSTFLEVLQKEGECAI